MSASEYDLGSAEFEVLRELWLDAPASVRQVLERLHDRGRRVAYTTVQTMLTRLEQKGYVVSDKSGQAFTYRPTVSRDRFSRSRVRALLDQLYDGAAGPLVLQLVKTRRLTEQERSQLQRLIEELDRKG